MEESPRRRSHILSVAPDGSGDYTILGVGGQARRFLEDCAGNPIGRSTAKQQSFGLSGEDEWLLAAAG
jgi:hypothetical protein